jgi:hypothetical protein
MRHQVFDRFVIDRFPRPSNGEHITPLALGIIGIALHHHLHILLRTIGRIPSPVKVGRLFSSTHE